MNKFFLQRRIPLQRRAGASGWQFSIINFQTIFNFRIFKI